MKIKIGNFNFINDNKNVITPYSKLDLSECFYLDGKENTLFVCNDYIMSLMSQNSLSTKFDKIIDFQEEAKQQINDYIKKTAEEIFKSGNYSKYDLYRNISLRGLLQTEYSSTYDFDSIYSNQSSFKINLDTNKISLGDFTFDLDFEKVENLEEFEKEGKFDTYIKYNLIKLERENGIEPKFVKEINNIIDYLTDKKTVNVLFNNPELQPVKIEAQFGRILHLDNNKVTLDFSYSTRENFSKVNPSFDYQKLELKDLQGFQYGNKQFLINTQDLMDIPNQIAVSLEDKLSYRIDTLKNQVQNDFFEYSCNNNNLPYSIEPIYKTISVSKEDGLALPEWYTEELQKILDKNALVDSLKEAKNNGDLQAIFDISKELKDEELDKILDNFDISNEEESSKRAEEEEEL